jgi:hypothetical protein
MVQAEGLDLDDHVAPKRLGLGKIPNGELLRATALVYDNCTHVSFSKQIL